MAEDPGKALIHRLAKAVADYQAPPFHLAHDLACAVRVQSVGAAEAVILYCARILEGMSPGVLRRFDLPAGDNVFSNLLVIERYQLMSSVDLTWAHALRLMGNKVRHMTSQLRQTDADLALFFAQRWLQWYFCDFRHGDRLPSLTSDQLPLGLSASPELDAVVEVMHDLQTNPDCTPTRALALGEQTRHQTPVISALLAEALIGRDLHEPARALLKPALQDHPNDPRLGQLLGLSYSRQKMLSEALDCLSPLYERYRTDDDTAGILAGVYKRLWQLNHKRADLERAHAIYRDAWQRLKDNSYLGVNAATTALLLDRVSIASRLAAGVESLLSGRAKALRQHGIDAQAEADYWTQVTWPELLLISGRLAEARQLYRIAFARHTALAAEVEVARKQAVEILRKQGLTAADQRWFEIDREPAPSGALRVAVTGHRKLAGGEALSQQVRAVLERLRAGGIAGHGPELVVLSALAEGADRLVAETALGEPFTGHLEVVLPLEVADYSQDFDSPQSIEQFQRLLTLADVIHFPPSPEQSGGGSPRGPAMDAAPQDEAGAEQRETQQNRGGGAARHSPPEPATAAAQRNAAYKQAGLKVVDEADVLVAIWDGRPAHGVGGTGEIVAYARGLGRPLAWIDAQAPHKVTWEGVQGEVMSDK